MRAYPTDDEGEAKPGDCCPFASPASNLALLQLCACPPKPGPSRALLARKTEFALPQLFSFADATLVYILSKQWKDLLSVNLFQLHVRPFCKEAKTAYQNCGHEAPVWQMAAFAFGLLVAATVVVRLSRVLAARRSWPSLEMVPAMAAMCVGWAAGDVSVRILQRFDAKASSRGLSFCSACNGSNFVLASICTLLSAGLLLVLQPYTGEAAARGGALLEWRRAALDLLTTALNYNVMIVWGAFFDHAVTWGVSAAQEGTPLLSRTLIFWAVSSTAVFAALTVRLVVWRQWLVRRQAAVTRSLEIEAPEVHEQIFRAEAAAGPDDAPASARRAPDYSQFGTRGGSERRGELASLLRNLETRLNRRAALSQFLVVVEGSFAWSTGLAWTAAVGELTSQADYPTPSVVGEDFGAAVVLTLVAAGWLVGSGQTTAKVEGRMGQREEVEKYFLTYSFSFVVGWAWVVLIRDITALLSDLVAGGADGSNRPHMSFVAQLVLTFVWGPLLTLLVLSTKRASFSRLCCARTTLEAADKIQASSKLGGEATAVSTVRLRAADPTTQSLSGALRHHREVLASVSNLDAEAGYALSGVSAPGHDSASSGRDEER